jgi:hypothetical protein
MLVGVGVDVVYDYGPWFEASLIIQDAFLAQPLCCSLQARLLPDPGLRSMGSANSCDSPLIPEICDVCGAGCVEAQGYERQHIQQPTAPFCRCCLLVVAVRCPVFAASPPRLVRPRLVVRSAECGVRLVSRWWYRYAARLRPSLGRSDTVLLLKKKTPGENRACKNKTGSLRLRPLPTAADVEAMARAPPDRPVVGPL